MPQTEVNWYRVTDYPSIQAAIDAATSQGGGTVYFPPGTYSRSTSLVLASEPDGYNPGNPLVLRGDGPNVSKIVSLFLNPVFDLLRIQRSYVSVVGLAFDGRATVGGPSRGIVIGGDPMRDTHHVAIRDCIIRNTQSYALEIVGGASPVPVASQCLFERCGIAFNFANDLVRVGERCFQHEFRDCLLDFFGGAGMELVSCREVTLIDGSISTPHDLGIAAYLTAQDATDCRVINCWFEEPTSVTSTQWFMDLGKSCNGWLVLGCRFERKLFFSGNPIRIIRIGDDAIGSGGPSVGVLILNPYILIPPIAPPGPPAGHITIRNSASECTLIGGTLVTSAGDKFPLDMLDPTTKSQWVGNRRFRLPQVTTAENPPGNSLHRGDVLMRAGRGLEAWNGYGTAPGPSFIPLSVNRYADQAALNGVPAASLNLGTLAWVDAESALKAFTAVGPPPVWNKVDLVP